jgi:CheY-like chemotaxis protein
MTLILLASVGEWSEVANREGSGVDAYLKKPVRQSHLMNTLATAWLRKKAVGAPQVIPVSEALDRFGPLVERLRAAPLRVLVAEDNIVNQKVAAQMLLKLGIRADVVGNGKEAAEMFGMLPYDIVFMDCQMPVMDGYDATRGIRRQEQPGRRAVIVALTAEALVGSERRCLEAGMDAYIVKPVRFEKLVETLVKWTRPPTGGDRRAVHGSAFDAAPEAHEDSFGAAGGDTVPSAIV